MLAFWRSPPPYEHLVPSDRRRGERREPQLAREAALPASVIPPNFARSRCTMAAVRAPAPPTSTFDSPCRTSGTPNCRDEQVRDYGRGYRRSRPTSPVEAHLGGAHDARRRNASRSECATSPATVRRAFVQYLAWPCRRASGPTVNEMRGRESRLFPREVRHDRLAGFGNCSVSDANRFPGHMIAPPPRRASPPSRSWTNGPA